MTNTIPTAKKVDITIEQTTTTKGKTSYTWHNLKFGDFSDWTSHFEDGTGTVVIVDSTTKETLLTVPDAPLTPGPLVHQAC